MPETRSRAIRFATLLKGAVPLMNIHEYQAKAVLKSFGAPVADGVPVLTLDDVQKAVDTLPGPLWVVKSQIHAGGRGKGKFIEAAAGDKGGVRLAFSKDEVLEHAKAMLGHHLVTAQTSDAGKQVNRLYIEDGADIATELYLSMLVDRQTGSIAVVASTEGGMDIEQVSHDTPDLIQNIQIDPTDGMTPAKAQEINDALKLTGDAAADGLKLFPILYKAFTEKDMAMLEINPLIVMENGHLRVLDAKVSFDGNALFRHPDIAELRDETEEDEKKTKKKSKPPNTTLPMLPLMETLAAWLTAQASLCRQWTSSSFTAKSLPTSSMSVVARRLKK